MAINKASETEPMRDDDLAVLAAMDLLENWTLPNIARAMGRSQEWLQSEIDKAIAADRSHAMN